MRFVLLTADGGFIIRGVMPPFITSPRFVIWGNRTFERFPAGEEDIYREVFSYHLTGLEFGQ